MLLKRFSQSLILLLLLSCAGHVAWGQTAPGVLTYHSTSRGGGVHRLLAHGDFIFAAEGSSLVVYDTRTPSYQRVFEKRFCSPITDMVLNKGFLYVTANHDGLSKWDLSIPIKPMLVGEYRPEDFSHAYQSVQFSGDTLFVAASGAVLMFKELTGIGAAFSKLGELAVQPAGKGRIVCGLPLGKNYIAAIVGKEKGLGQGIHAYRVSPEIRLNFHQYESGETEGLIAIPRSNRVIAFGGRSAAGRSLVMGLDFKDPGHPEQYWVDSVGAKAAGAAIQSGLIQGDTLMVPYEGIRVGGCPGEGGVLLYSLKTPGQVRSIGQVPLPQVPLHIALSGRKLHVAMGDHGIVSFDLGRWKPGSCEPLSEVGRSQASGGYCYGADAMHDQLITASGKAGAILHMIQDRKMLATRSIERVGVVHQARFIGDGSHAALWIASSRADSLVIVQLADGKVVGKLEGPLGHRLVMGWKDRFVCGRDDKSGFDILDLRNPQKPRREQSVLVNFNDLSLDAEGKLVVSTEHNVRVFDLSAGGLSEVTTYAKWGEGFGAVASEADVVYASSYKRGLIRFRLVKEAKGVTLKEEVVWKLPHKQPQRLALDANGLYVAYNDYGVYALDKVRLSTTGYYRTGLEYRANPELGLQDISCREGKIYIVEHFGQVTILKRCDVE